MAGEQFVQRDTPGRRPGGRRPPTSLSASRLQRLRGHVGGIPRRGERSRPHCSPQVEVQQHRHTLGRRRNRGELDVAVDDGAGGPSRPSAGPLPSRGRGLAYVPELTLLAAGHFLGQASRPTGQQPSAGWVRVVSSVPVAGRPPGWAGEVGHAQGDERPTSEPTTGTMLRVLQPGQVMSPQFKLAGANLSTTKRPARLCTNGVAARDARGETRRRGGSPRRSGRCQGSRPGRRGRRSLLGVGQPTRIDAGQVTRVAGSTTRVSRRPRN